MKQRRLFDKDCLDICDGNANMMVPWYIMAAYAYYEEDAPILEDATFDRLAKRLLAQWDTIEHMHKKHLSKDTLLAGTYLGDYPTRVKDALFTLAGKPHDD